MADWVTTNAPIFLMGSPRSGTSMLHWLICAHPDLAYVTTAANGMYKHKWIKRFNHIYLPNPILKRFHRIFLPAEGVRYEKQLSFLNLFPFLPAEGYYLWKDIINSDNSIPWKDQTVQNLREHPEKIRKVKTQYKKIMSILGKNRFVDKSPSYIVFWRLIEEIFPDAFFINIVRDGRAVVNSKLFKLKFRKWSGSTKREYYSTRPDNADELIDKSLVEKACHEWNYHIRLGQEAKEILGRRCLQVRYEDVVSNTRAELDRIFQFAYLSEFDLNFYPEALENRNYKWQSNKEEFDDFIWTNKPSISQDEMKHLEIMRPYLEDLHYVEPGAKLYPG